MPGSGKGGTVEDVLIEFLGRDSLSNVGKNVEKSLQTVQKQAESTSKSLESLEKSAGNLQKSFDKAAGGGTSGGVNGFNNQLQKSQSQLENYANGMQKLQFMFMDFGIIMAGMAGQSLWDKFMAPAIKLEDARSTLIFMGESAEAVDKMNESITTYAANASKVAMPEIMSAWQMVRLQSKVSADQMERMTPILGDTVAQFKANGRTAEAASMAIADGLAGQFKRMQEIGIKQDDLKATGLWKGTTEDVEGFFKALEKIYSDRGLTGIAQKTVSTADYLNIVSEKLEMAFMKLGEKFLPVLKDGLEWFIKLLESGAGDILAWTVLIGGLALIFIFLAPFILSTIVMVKELTTVQVLNAAGSATQVGGLRAVAANLGLVKIEGDATTTSMTRLGTAMSLLGVALGGAIIGWQIYEYMMGESRKRVEELQKGIDGNNDSLGYMEQRYSNLYQRMKEGQDTVYDTETGKWINISTAVDKAGNSYDQLIEKNKQAKWAIAQEEGKWDQYAENLTTGPLGAQPKLKRSSALGQAGEVSDKEGGGSFSPDETRILDYIGNVLDLEEAELKENKTRKAGESDAQYRKRLDEEYNKVLKTQLGLSDDQISKFRKANTQAHTYKDNMDKLNKSMDRFWGAVWKVIGAIFGFSVEEKTASGQTKDLADRVIDMANFIEGLNQKLEESIQYWNSVAILLDQVSAGINQLKQDIGTGDWLAVITDLGYMSRGEWSQFSAGGGSAGNTASDVQTKIQEKLAGQPTKGSPLAFKTVRGKTLLQFPQFTPDFLAGMERFGKERQNMGGEVGGAVVHHHNENITIDASHMSESQLVKLMTSIYQGINQRRNITIQPSPDSGGVAI